MILLMKKAARAIWGNKKAYIACIFLLSIGVAMLAAFSAIVANLNTSMETFYTDYRFGDVFAQVKAMPVTGLDRLRSIPGIKSVTGRIVRDARVLLGGDNEKVVKLRFLSCFNESDEPLDQFMLEEGQFPKNGQILVGNRFLKANGLAVGDKLNVILDGREVTLEVSGSVKNPEYIYIIEDAANMLPDESAFGYAGMPDAELRSLTAMNGAVNDIVFALEDGYTFDDVKIALEDQLGRYELRSLIAREDQLSHSMLDQELTSIAAMSSSIPLVFVMMAVIILYIMLKRVIEMERTQIGTLKAMGYTTWEVLFNYISYGLFIGLVGGILGIILGYMMVDGMMGLYAIYFDMPMGVPQIQVPIALRGMAIAVAAGAAGAFAGARGLAFLTPAVAMRPAAPPLITRDVLSSLPRRIQEFLSQNFKVAVRSISRNRFRSAFVVVGIAFAYSLMAFMLSFSPMIDMMTEQLTKVAGYDIKVTLEAPQSLNSVVDAGQHLPDVKIAQGILEIPCELSAGHLKTGVMLTAVEADSPLYYIYDSKLAANIPPPSSGIIISNGYARKLGVSAGDSITVKTPYAKEDLQLTIAQVVNQYVGGGAYMELGALCDLLGTQKTVTGLMVTTGDMSGVKVALANAGNVKAVQDRAAAIQSQEDTIATSMSMIYIMQVAAVAVAFAIIYNASSIALSERSREYATMRVIGMTPGEVGGLMGTEHWILFAGGCLGGIPLAELLRIGVGSMVDMDAFTMPDSTPFYCFVIAAAATAVVVILANWTSKRHIGRLSLVEVLKERE